MIESRKQETDDRVDAECKRENRTAYEPSAIRTSVRQGVGIRTCLYQHDLLAMIPRILPACYKPPDAEAALRRPQLRRRVTTGCGAGGIFGAMARRTLPILPATPCVQHGLQK